MRARTDTLYISIPATYRPTGVSDFDGNPFIEALPPMEESKNAILSRLQNYPLTPTKSELKKGEIIRAAELGRIRTLVYPFAEYQRAGMNLTLNIREAYVARNPLNPVDMQRRLAIASGDGEFAIPNNWVSTAKGQTLIGISGSGKTTFATAFSLPYQIVIEHREYKGKPLVCRQIPWVNLRMAHDATLKSLCLQFFDVVDGILGNTNFYRQARSVSGIARMSLLMAHVATVASIGVIFVDELQNLKAAKGGNAVFVLNLFSEIIERAGVTLVIAGTPALETVVSQNVRNLRKLGSGGDSHFVQMKYGDIEFNSFCETYWDYQFVAKPLKLSGDIKRAWFEASGGNPAFTALAFMLAQRNEIGGRETVDRAAFERVARYDMASLQPAIAALLSGDPAALAVFDDLLSGAEPLRSLIAWKGGTDQPTAKEEEFPELEKQEPVEEGKPQRKKPAKPVIPKKEKEEAKVTLPMEIPF
ncbi:AAA domain-containing protein [Collimonas sp. PA-H2]|uniref:ATP-binding protein n=1 Tax=Collimonas sp. PA-H2 TaxID=1881062 RepID=UPI000BF8224C|nr:ATP-binding protein [Collimonas sp. PA-H2]PFH10106.1 AAA domain-containing protein [Collimonas sp. PA-H2]